MHETEFYQRILGLQSPWVVSDVKLDTEAGQVDIHVEHCKSTKFCCPECGTELACYDHVSTRRWRHLDTMQYRTILHAAPPRVKCPEHGVKQVALPRAQKSSRFTLFFERFAIDVPLATQTLQGAHERRLRQGSQRQHPIGGNEDRSRSFSCDEARQRGRR